MTAPVVIYVGSGSWSDPAAAQAGHASGFSSGASAVPQAVDPERMRGGDPVARAAVQDRRSPALDPFRIHAEFPERWSAYIRAHFRNVSQVIAAFDVSERTARKWWEAETGANGGNVAVACRMHPETAPQMLFAA
jgi:hypothetical protein